MKFCNELGESVFEACSKFDGQCTRCRIADLEQWNMEMTDALNEIVMVTPMNQPAFSIACLVIAEIGVEMGSPENR